MQLSRAGSPAASGRSAIVTEVIDRPAWLPDTQVIPEGAGPVNPLLRWLALLLALIAWGWAALERRRGPGAARRAARVAAWP